MSDQELLSSDFLTDPYPFYDRWRQERPVWWSDWYGGYVISRHADAKRVLTDPSVVRQSMAFDGALVDALGSDAIVTLDPPAHTALRDAIKFDFRPRELEARLGESIRSCVQYLMANLTPGVPFELSREISGKLVMNTMATLIGTDNSGTLKALYSAVFAYLSLSRRLKSDPETEMAGRQAGHKLMEYISDLMGQAGAEGGRGLLAKWGLLATPSKELLAATCANVLVAGVETTIGGIANAIYALYSHPSQLELVRNDPNLAGKAFEEGLRWISPVQMKGKDLVGPITIDQTQLVPGGRLLVVLASANRDPERYQLPVEFDISRANVDHLAFGAGIHYCLGAPVARLEASILIKQLMTEHKTLMLDPSREKPTLTSGPLNRSPKELWMVI